MTLYETLGVSQDAIPEVIKAAYKAMSQKYHPDLNGGGAQTTAMMQEINAAYSILSSPAERARYDQKLKAEQAASDSWRKSESGNGAGPSSDQARSENEDDDEESFDSNASEPLQKNASYTTPPKKIPYLGKAEYAALILFGLFTAFILFSGHGTPAQTTASGPERPASVPIPAAPPRIDTDNQAEAKSRPARNSPPAMKILSPPNGTAWPSASGYVPGYESTDYGGSIVDLLGSKASSAFFVKLVNSGHGAKSASRYVYVGAHQDFSIVNIAPGNYFLVYQDLMNGKYYQTGTFTLAQGIAPADPTHLQFTTVRFEFSAIGNGYLDSRQISARDFEAR